MRSNYHHIFYLFGQHFYKKVKQADNKMFDRDGRQQFIYIILIVSALVVTVQVMLRRNLVVDPFREDDAPRGKNRTAESVIHTESKDRQINFRLVSAESLLLILLSRMSSRVNP